MTDADTSTANGATGGCLCGGVRFTISETPLRVGICHCNMCRRWTSGPMMALHLNAPPRIDSDENLTWYRSSAWAERGFCRKCGTSLFYRLADDHSHLVPSAGALDDPGLIADVESEIFIDEKPAFYDFAGDTPRMTGPDFIAMVTGEKDERP